VKPTGGEKGKLTVVCEVVKEERGKIEKWVEENEMEQMEDVSNKL